jgi:lipoprotein NlpI
MNQKNVDPWQLVKNGQYQEAIEIYSQLYEDQKRPFHLFNRGTVKLLEGEYAGALGDFKQASIEAGEQFQGADDFIYQGICFWYLKSPSETIACWQRSLSARYVDVAGGVRSPALLLYAAERLNDSNLRQRAVSLLRKHARRRIRDWPAPVVPFLLGKTSMIDFEKEAAKASHPTLIARRQCQANFYMAVRALMADDLASFRNHMTLAARGPEGLYEAEYFLARWEIENNFLFL